MAELGFWNQGASAAAAERGMSSEGRWAQVLGVVALTIGLGTLLGGAYVGFGSTGVSVALPGGLPPASPETVAIFMFACGAVTMLLGAISIYKAHED
jgi:hypothetical protein